MVPVVHAHTNLSVLLNLGRILSHGYIISGFLPVRIAFPVIAGIVLGKRAGTIPDNILIEAFVSSLSTYDAVIVKDGMAFSDSTIQYSNLLQNNLIAVLSRYGW